MSFKWKWDAEIKKKGNEGFNDAGILTFNSNLINSFVREMIQNSNDAKSKKKSNIKIKIEHIKIYKTLIPAYDQFEEILGFVKDSNPNQEKFFDEAKRALRNEKIDFLVYSDFNTTGLSGNDDDYTSSFAACVLSEGISAKDNNNAGGSFGIGKNAIYSVSTLRTVFYSSLNESGEYIFQGVAKLASYKKGKNNHESRVYLGEGSERLAVRNPKEIPPLFKREQPGLSQFVMGVNLDVRWITDITKSVLKNYWSLLLDHGLEIEIIENGKVVQTIDSSNTIALIKRYYKEDPDRSTLQPIGNPLFFTEALKSNKIEFDIPHIGKCDFFYKEMSNGENNIAYLRNGMVVYTKVEQRLPGANITGVFRCQTTSGDEILRKMEPPKHDSFEPEMLARNHKLDKLAGEKILKQIRTDIRNQIKSLIEKYKLNIETPPFISELFEDLQKSIEGYNRGERKNQKSDIETLPKRAGGESIEVCLSSETDNSLITNKTGQIITQEGGKGSETIIQKSSSKEGKISSNGASESGNKDNPKDYIKSRVFFHSRLNSENVHKAIIRSEIPDMKNIEMRILQYGDSGNETAFILHEIKDGEGQIIPFQTITDGNGLITDYLFIIKELNREKQLYFTVTENQKSAFILN